MTESSLHKQGALAADDKFIEVNVGQIQEWSAVGAQQELPQPYAKLDIRKIRGMSGCGYSARRLFFPDQPHAVRQPGIPLACE